VNNAKSTNIEGGIRKKSILNFYNYNKFFTIITVVLNASKDLEKTIISLKKQKFKNFEHLIIDGGSNEQTLMILKKYNNSISYWISSRDGGIYDAMNKGINLAKGKFIGMLNSGDTYNPNSLKIVHSYIKNNPGIDFIFGPVKKKILKWKYNPIKIYWSFDFYSSHSSGFFIKSTAQKKIGIYDTKYKISSDFDFFYRMIVKNKMKGIMIPKDTVIGNFKSGTSYSSKFLYIEHLIEETKIRINNKQNIIVIFIIFIFHFFMNIKKINLKNNLYKICNEIKLLFFAKK